MFLERLVGTCKFPTTLVTLSLQLWIYVDWYCTNMLKVRHQFRCGLLWSFSSLKRQKIFNPSKCWMVTMQLPLNDLSFQSVLVLFIASFIVRLLFVPVLLFDSVFYSMKCFCSIWFFCSVFKLFSVCSVLILECIPGIYILLNINHQAVNEHHTADSAIFCLRIGNMGSRWRDRYFDQR